MIGNCRKGEKLATQNEVIDFIKSNFKHEQDGMTFKLIYDLGDGRSQVVFAFVNEHNIQFSSPFGSVNDVTPKQALDANAVFSCGMQLVGDTYFVRNVAPIENLDASEVTDGFELVAAIADDLENQLVGGDKY